MLGLPFGARSTNANEPSAATAPTAHGTTASRDGSRQGDRALLVTGIAFDARAEDTETEPIREGRGASWLGHAGARANSSSRGSTAAAELGRSAGRGAGGVRQR